MKRSAKVLENSYTEPQVQVQMASGLPPNSHFANNMEKDKSKGKSNINPDLTLEKNPLANRKSKKHCKTIAAALLLVVGVSTAIALFVKSIIGIGPLIGIIVGSYFLYLIIGCCNNTLRTYVSSIEKGQKFETVCESMRKGVGYFQFRAECYHYKTTTHTSTMVNEAGRTRTQTYTTTEKIITHTGSEKLVPKFTKDQSGMIERGRIFAKIIFIRFNLNYRFADSRSEANFDEFYEGFAERHNLDVYCDFSFEYILPGFTERKAFYVEELECRLSQWFYFCGMIGCLYPFSVWMECQINRFTVNMVKTVAI